MTDITAKPFNLDERAATWVRDTLSKMSDEEKIGQLFCPQLACFNREQVEYYTRVLKVGAVMLRPFEREGLKENIRAMQESCEIPLLVAANLENGGNGVVTDGTLFANPMGCAATGDKINGYRLGKIACGEAGEIGVNWAFAPIVDIDRNYHNPITNVRTFGGNTDTVLAFAREYIRAAAEEKVVPTIKHFPGDGVDERDQHLLVSVNDLSYDDWMRSFGKVYKTLIDDGTPTIMAGHIAAPNVAKAVGKEISWQETLLPASQSKTLLTDFLRGTLEFNGLVVTDSTLMVGYMQSMPRKRAVPYSVECGADMILFNRSIEEDIAYMREGLKSGILSRARLDEAVTRILALKASMGLYKKDFSVCESKERLFSETKEKWVCECADKAVTLVKDNRKLLPLSPEKTKRIYLNVIENTADNRSPFASDIKARLAREGFKVTLRRRKYAFDPNALTLEKITPAVDKALKEAMCNTEQFVSKYDLCLIVLNMQTASNATVVRVNWNVLFGMGNDLPWYAGELPLVAVSVNNPYHLLDIPMAHAYINAYTNNAATLDAVFEKLMGRSEFKGVSPVDAFCGKEDTRL